MQQNHQVMNFKIDMSLSELKDLRTGQRRRYHDDITILVVDL